MRRRLRPKPNFLAGYPSLSPHGSIRILLPHPSLSLWDPLCRVREIYIFLASGGNGGCQMGKKQEKNIWRFPWLVRPVKYTLSGQENLDGRSEAGASRPRITHGKSRTKGSGTLELVPAPLPAPSALREWPRIWHLRPRVRDRRIHKVLDPCSGDGDTGGPGSDHRVAGRPDSWTQRSVGRTCLQGYCLTSALAEKRRGSRQVG